MRWSTRSTISGSPTAKAARSPKQRPNRRRRRLRAPRASSNNRSSNGRPRNNNGAPRPPPPPTTPPTPAARPQTTTAPRPTSHSDLADHRKPQRFAARQRTVKRQRREIRLADQRRLELFMILPARYLGGAECPKM